MSYAVVLPSPYAAPYSLLAADVDITDGFADFTMLL